MKDKNPTLKLRYAKGLGDIIACILHSKMLGWFVHFLSGQNEPCSACSQRAMALNILFPIPVWKLFFKNQEELEVAFLKDLENAGYIPAKNQNQSEKVMIKNEIDKISNKDVQKQLNEQLEKTILKNKIDQKLITTNKTEIGDYIVQVNIYKK